MPRKPRIHLPGGFYHIILRGNARQDIYCNSADRITWQMLLADGLNHYKHRLHAYCWMTNHVHMAVQAGTEPLARFMAYLASNYARRFNLRNHRSGHLFEQQKVPGTALCVFELFNEFCADCYVVSNRDGHHILAQDNPAGVMFPG